MMYKNLLDVKKKMDKKTINTKKSSWKCNTEFLQEDCGDHPLWKSQSINDKLNIIYEVTQYPFEKTRCDGKKNAQ